jgi:hypothetical protein
MAQGRGRARLGLEAQTVLGVGGQPRMKQLDRYCAVESLVPTVADFGHAAATKDTPQCISTAEQLAGRHEVNGKPRRQCAVERRSPVAQWTSAEAG